MKKNLVGTFEKLRFIGDYPNIMIRFTLITDEGHVNCIATKEIANRLMMMVEKKEIAVYGHYNAKNQLVIEKMMIRNPSSFTLAYISKNRKYI